MFTLPTDPNERIDQMLARRICTAADGSYFYRSEEAAVAPGPEPEPRPAPEPVVELEPPAGKKRSQTDTILAYLSEKGSSTVNHIAAGTGIPKSSVSAWVSVLLRKGNIQVAGSTLHDGRTIKTYAMNENGHELVTQP